MKKFAIIVAGGIGTRMRSDLPKQFLLLHNKPILYYTIKKFLDAFSDLSVILVLPEEYISMGQEIVDGFFDHTRVHITSGGRTRFHSVQKGLQCVEGESIIFVHDGVRCMVSEDLIQRCYQVASDFGTAIPVVPLNDSIRMINGDDNEPLERDNIRCVQTPQTFHSGIILPAYAIDYKEKFTDEATVVEAYGLKVHLVEGDPDNIKITKPVDLVLAELLLE